MNNKTQLTRRNLLKSGAATAAGLSFLPSTAHAETQTFDQSKATAKSVIYIHVHGGLSHVDSFDIKEANRDAMRASEPINTSADGIRIGKYFPKLAKQMHHCAIINSMSNTQGAHKEANYLLRTGMSSEEQLYTLILVPGLLEWPQNWVKYLHLLRLDAAIVLALGLWVVNMLHYLLATHKKG